MDRICERDEEQAKDTDSSLSDDESEANELEIDSVSSESSIFDN